jgi:hypothetical protein
LTSPPPAREYAGEFRRLANISSDSRGSIHDAPAAHALGFRGAFVPGSVVGTKTLLAASLVLGPRWLEGGFYELTFVSPVYESDEVQEVGRPADGQVRLQLVTPEGRICCAGRAGLGHRLPWEGQPAGGDGVLPRVPIGREFPDTRFSISAAEVAPLLAAAGAADAWRETEAVLGAPVAPPERLHRVALDISRTIPLETDGVRQPGMWAMHALALREPVLLDRPYTMRQRIVDKGRSGRTIHVTYEFTVVDGIRVVAVGRHRVKWLAL